ncbi:MAG TPA: DNA polymerase I, partial [Enterovirga sp.]
LACDLPFCRTLSRARNLARVIGTTARKVLDNADQARMSLRLVTLHCETPVDVPLEDLAVADFDARRLIAFTKALQLTVLTKRAAEAYGVDAGQVDADPDLAAPWEGGTSPEDGVAEQPEAGGTATSGRLVRENGEGSARALTPQNLVAARSAEPQALPCDRTKYVAVRTIEDLDRWIGAAREHGLVAIGTQTSSLDPMRAEIVGFSMALEPALACYVPLRHRGGESLFDQGLLPDQVPFDEAIARLKALLEDPGVLKIGQNLKYDWLVLSRHGIEIGPYDDTMLVSYVLDAGRMALNGHGMDQLAKAYLEHTCLAFHEVAGKGKTATTFDLVPLEKATEYAAEDSDVTLRLWRMLKPRLVAERKTAVYEGLERGMVATLARMERRGIAIDRQILSRMSGDFAQTIARVEDEVFEIAGERFTIGSPKQLADILFGKFGLPGARKTATGQWSTGARLLEDLAESSDHPLPRKILEWRQITKLKSYTDALPTYIHPETGRVHTSYSLASTTTGRLSSTDPNLQNIPIRTEEGRKIRTAFVAEPGHKLISADYSQIELRLLADMADIPQLRAAFANGVDIHATTASEMFGVPVEGMPSDIRRRAKAINFGIVYGISAFGLANQLGIPRDEAGQYIRTYFERFPGIRDYMDKTKRAVREHGYVETMFGRACHYPDISAGNASVRAAVERQAINAPIQGTAADIIRRAMIRMDAALRDAKLSAKMLLQVHDELVFEVPEDEVDATLPVIRRVMEDAPHPVVQL